MFQGYAEPVAGINNHHTHAFTMILRLHSGAFISNRKKKWFLREASRRVCRVCRGPACGGVQRGLAHIV